MNFKGRTLETFGRHFGSIRLQPLFERVQRLLEAGRNVGGATNDYHRNGEFEVMRMIKSRYGTDEILTIFDVGAHRGDYAKLLFSVFGSSMVAFCFEPSESLFRELVKNLPHPPFRHFRIGLGDEETSGELFSPISNIPTMLSDSFAITGETIQKSEKIQVVPLDSFCKKFQVQRIHFLKIDVEGYELRVLQGARDMIEADGIDYIQFEFGQHCVAARTYFKDFFDLLSPQYRIFRVLRRGIYELKLYSSSMENFVSATNYLAISRRMEQ